MRFEKAEYCYLVLALGLFVYLGAASFNHPYLSYTYDYWEHTASLKELSANMLNPQNPRLHSGVPSPRYTVYLLIWAAVKNILNTDVFKTMALASIGNLCLFLTGLYWFVREYFHDRRLPVYVLVIILFYWGRGFIWSGEYQLRSFIYNLGYPLTFSFGCFLWNSYFIVRYLRSPHLLTYLAALFLGAVGFLCHPFTITLLFPSAIILAIIERKTSVIERLLVVVLPPIYLLLSFLWPYFSMYELLFYTGSRSLAGTAGGWIYYPRDIFYSLNTMFALGPLLIGVVFIWHFVIQKKNLYIIFCFLVSLAGYILAYFLPLMLGYRIIFNVVFYLHLAIAFMFCEWRLFSIQSLRQAILCKTDSGILKFFLIIISIVAVAYNINLAIKVYPLDYIYKQNSAANANVTKDMVRRFSFLSEIIGDYEVILADQYTSLILPTFCGKVISVRSNSSNPLVESRHQRRDDNINFFKKETPTEQRQEILSKYNVSYILLNADFVSPKFNSEFEKLGTVLVRRDNLVLIKR